MEYCVSAYSIEEFSKILAELKEESFRWYFGNNRTIDPQLNGENEKKCLEEFTLMSKLSKHSSHFFAINIFTDTRLIKSYIASRAVPYHISEERVWKLASDIFSRRVSSTRTYDTSDIKFAVKAAVDFVNVYPSVVNNQLSAPKPTDWYEHE